MNLGIKDQNLFMGHRWMKTSIPRAGRVPGRRN